MTKIEEAIRLRAIIENAISQVITDDNAFDAMSLFPSWNPNSIEYKLGDRVKHEGTLYKCLSPHTSQADWAPGSAVSLWVRMDNPNEEWPLWVQPTGAHDAYPMDAKVSHNGAKWISTIDANVYMPGVYGWTEYVEEAPQPDVN